MVAYRWLNTGKVVRCLQRLSNQGPLLYIGAPSRGADRICAPPSEIVHTIYMCVSPRAIIFIIIIIITIYSLCCRGQCEQFVMNPILEISAIQYLYPIHIICCIQVKVIIISIIIVDII